jgi:hypothetical protein
MQTAHAPIGLARWPHGGDGFGNGAGRLRLPVWQVAATCCETSRATDE